jgi:CheY-like chemotaxis protein
MVECQAMIEPQRQSRGISMTFPAGDLPTCVEADRTRLKQVLINLLSNALKYNRPSGSVVVEVATPAPGRVRISIRDTGEGLSADKVAQLFESFNRLGQEASVEEGTGIGLVVSKRLVELMGGVIGVESVVGVGSVFWIELLSTDRTVIALEKTEAADTAPPQVLTGGRVRTVLYVEDNPANLTLVEQLMARHADMHLISARDGNQGVTIARSAQPEVILMDINLPGLNGLEAMKILRADPATSHIPIVALSANALPRDIKKGVDAGFFRYLTKPIKVKELMDTLSEALELADQTRPRS